MRECHHKHSIELIWGPPGTGKTKTVATMLHCFLELKTITLACAPTNNAVLELAARLLSMVKDSLKYDTYGFGDIVLFGHSSRLKVEGYEGLGDLFLEYRADKLFECFAGWERYKELMISLLENPREQYLSYKSEEESGVISLEKFAEEEDSSAEEMYRLYMKTEGKVVPMTFEQFLKDRYSWIVEEYNLYEHEERSIMTFEQFVKQRFSSTAEKLELFMKTLYTHLRTSIIKSDTVKDMFKALDLLKSIENFLCQTNFKHAFDDHKFGEIIGNIFDELSSIKEECLLILKSLSQETSRISKNVYKCGITYFCLMNAPLVICMHSSHFCLFALRWKEKI